MNSRLNKATLNALAGGRYGNPFSLLGLHQEGDARIVRTFQPQAVGVDLLVEDIDGGLPMQKVHPAGIFETEMPARKRRYRTPGPNGRRSRLSTPRSGDLSPTTERDAPTCHGRSDR